jgi:hypothetical protein
MADGKRPERSKALADAQCSSEREHATSLIRRRGESSKIGASIIAISSSAKASDSSKILGGVTVAIMTATFELNDTAVR